MTCVLRAHLGHDLHIVAGEVAHFIRVDERARPPDKDHVAKYRVNVRTLAAT